VANLVSADSSGLHEIRALDWLIPMILTDPSNYASDTFGFLSTSGGQIVLAVGSVLLVVLFRAMAHRSEERAFRLDDLAVGPDLLVLAIVTLVGYAASQFVAEKHAEAISDFKAADIYGSHQVNAAILSLAFGFVLFFGTWMIQRVGEFSSIERVQKRSGELGEGQRIRGLLEEEEKRIRKLLDEEEERRKKLPEEQQSGKSQAQEREGESQRKEEERIGKLLQEIQGNLKEYLDAPRYKLGFGLIAPDSVGILLLIVAIKSAVQ
jgi:hypothetical protein